MTVCTTVAATGVRAGKDSEQTQPVLGCGIGGTNRLPTAARSESAFSHPMPQHQGGLIPSLPADRPTHVSSGLAVPERQESRSRVFYGWLLPVTVKWDHGRQGINGEQPPHSKSRWTVCFWRSVSQQPSTKAPCDKQHSPALLPAARGKTFQVDTSGTRPGIRTMTVDDSRSVLNNQDRQAGACVVSLSWH